MTPARCLAVLLLAAVAASVATLWPAGGDSLVIYSAMGPPGGMIRAFEKQAGVRVTYVNMGGGPLQARLYAEGARPRWTVAWFVGDAAMAALDRAGMLARPAPWPEAPPPDWTPDARALLPADGAYLPTGLTLAGVFLTRRAQPAPSPSWAALPDRAGGVGLVSPVASGTAYPVLSAMMEAAGGVAQGHALLQALRRSGLVVGATNPLLLGRLRAGDVALCVLPSEAAYTLAARDPGLRVTVPAPAGLMPEVIGVSARASPAARALAGRFIRFVLEREGQGLVRASTAEGMAWPPVRDVPAPPELPELARLDLMHPDAATWGARQGEEIGWFRREIAP
ncbi:MAG: ABC transporter substrate-binding protein [Janthinobacterium lividum]